MHLTLVVVGLVRAPADADAPHEREWQQQRRPAPTLVIPRFTSSHPHRHGHGHAHSNSTSSQNAYSSSSSNSSSGAGNVYSALAPSSSVHHNSSVYASGRGSGYPRSEGTGSNTLVGMSLLERFGALSLSTSTNAEEAHPRESVKRARPMSYAGPSSSSPFTSNSVFGSSMSFAPYTQHGRSIAFTILPPTTPHSPLRRFLCNILGPLISMDEGDLFLVYQRAADTPDNPWFGILEHLRPKARHFDCGRPHIGRNQNFTGLVEVFGPWRLQISIPLLHQRDCRFGHPTQINILI
ncbi:hypothetical protein B0H10DRAFT_1328698 [Mycena sp. CBHHK59/15]|nr:hypothetical protein B0H10DRAFT_1328698 [Mycena sp. CBHHK59/15]